MLTRPLLASEGGLVRHRRSVLVLFLSFWMRRKRWRRILLGGELEGRGPAGEGPLFFFFLHCSPRLGCR